MKTKIKIGLIIGLIFLSFVFGVSTGRYKHFPYDQFFYLYNGHKKVGNFEWGGRNFNINFYEEKELDFTSDTGVYLTYGQSNSVNSGQLGYMVKNEVLQFLLGQTYIYEDPALGGTGVEGSVWGMVGDKLIEKGVHDKVVFSNSGWGTRKMEELKEGHYVEFLIQNYIGLMKKFGRVDGILFHQGESNNSPNGIDNYYSDFVEFFQTLKNNGIEIPIYLSRVSFCGEDQPPNINLTNIQNQLIEDFDIVKEGPNTDLLIEKKYRIKDSCHFSLEGYDKFSDMWVESLIK